MLTVDMKIKRRSGNFSEQEVALIKRLVAQRNDILESKKTDATTVLLKKAAWEDLAEEFNRITDGGIHREAKALRKKFENWKTEIRKGRLVLQDYEETAPQTDPQKLNVILKSEILEKTLNVLEKEDDIDSFPEECFTNDNDDIGDNYGDDVDNAKEDLSEIEILSEDYGYDPLKLNNATTTAVKVDKTNYHKKRTTLEKMADVKEKFYKDKFSNERKRYAEEHDIRMRILDLQEEEAKYRLEEAKKRVKLVDMEILKMQKENVKKNNWN